MPADARQHRNGASSESTPTIFDRDADVLVTQEHRPHWAQSGTIVFVTMRLADSIPREVAERWDRERLAFLRQHGVDGDDWKTGRTKLSAQARRLFDKRFDRARETALDACSGRCILRRPSAARMVADAFLHFDGQRYDMGDFVVMPNHAHCLVAFRRGSDMRKQCGEWMRFTARRINPLFRQSGKLWHAEPFDHLVRSQEQLEYLRTYIRANPVKARLNADEFLYRRSAGLF